MPQPQRPKAKPARQVQIGRQTRALPSSTATPEGRQRAALTSALDRTDRLKAQHAEQVKALREENARIKADNRHDLLVRIASEHAAAGKLDAAQAQKLQTRLLNEDQRYRAPLDAHGKPVPFPLRDVLARLLDAIHKETGGAAGIVDVRKMSAAEYAEHCRKRGLHMPALGYHMPV